MFSPNSNFQDFPKNKEKQRDALVLAIYVHYIFNFQDAPSLLLQKKNKKKQRDGIERKNCPIFSFQDPPVPQKKTKRNKKMVSKEKFVLLGCPLSFYPSMDINLVKFTSM